jgi:protein-arginine kinase activator protein McsA
VRIGQAQRAAADPAKRDLLTKKEELEQKIDKLKYEKAAMPEDEYKSQLTTALVDLARVQQELDK